MTLPYQPLLLEFLREWLTGGAPLPQPAALAAAEHFLDGAIAGAGLAGEDPRQASVHYCVRSYAHAVTALRALPPREPPATPLACLREYRTCLHALQQGGEPPVETVERAVQFFEQLGRAPSASTADEDDYE